MESRILLSFAAALAFIPSLFAGAPPNDKVAKATVLKGTTGQVNSTNVEATKDPNFEPTGFAGSGNTVWYSFTAPTDGFLEVAVDSMNSAGSTMLLSAFDVSPGRGFTRYEEVRNTTSGFSGSRPTLVIPFTRGFTHKLQFDTEGIGFGLPSTAGTFSFSYEFKTGSAFGLEAQSGGGLFFFREGGDPISITVTRNASTEGPASVDYSLETDTANATDDLDTTGSDPLTGTLNFLPGESRKTLSFTIKQDALNEGQEVLDFRLSNPSAGSVLLTAFQNITIDDDEGVPTNDNFANAVTVTGEFVTEALPTGVGTREAGEPGLLGGSVWYKWTAPSNGVLTLSTTLNAFPCVLFTGTTLGNLVQQRPTETPPTQPLDSTGYYGGIYPVTAHTAYFIAVARYDSATTADLKLRLDGVNTGDSSLEAAIIGFARDTFEVLESAGTATVTLTRTGGTTKKTLVDFTTSKTTTDPEDNFSFDFSPFAEPGTDYVVKTETITFEAGETTKNIPITINNDTKKEGIEHFNVRLSTDAQVFVQLDAINTAVVHINEGKALPSFGMFKATYSGVLAPAPSSVADGTLTISLTATGKFTGSLVLNGAKFPLQGTFPPLPSAPRPGDKSSTRLNLPRTGLSDIVVDLDYVFDQFGFASIECEVSDGTGMATGGTASPGFFSKQQPLGVVGTFTVVLTPDANVPPAIRQPGFLTLDVKSKGTFKMLGGLPDGTKVSGSGFMDAHSLGQNLRYDAHFVLPLYKGAGSLGGSLHLTHPGDPVTTPSAGDGSGTVRWSHPVVTTGPVLTAFGAALDPFVSRYNVPKGALVLNTTAGAVLGVEFDGGNITNINVTGTLGAKSAVTFPPATTGAPSVKFVAKNGLFGGKFTPAGATKPLTFQGAVSRNRNTASGYFLNGSDAGGVAISLK